jgi:hypothetical protein
MIRRLTFAVACALGVSALGVSVSPAAAQQDLLQQAGFLAGCWEARSGERTTMEMWMPPAADLMVGGGRTTLGGNTRDYEHLRLHERDGRLHYTAIPSGQRETTFSSTKVSGELLVFENPEHDFPQAIIYRRVGVDSLVARIEGPGPNQTTRGFDIPMRRVSCTPAALP